MRRVTGLVVASVLVGALGACAGGDPEPSFSPTQFASATPTPTPTPTATEAELVGEIGVVMDLSDPELGFELVDVPTDLEGDDADVYTTLALFQREFWRGLTLNEVSPYLYSFTAPNVTTVLEEIASSNASDRARVGGHFRATITEIDVDGDVATAIVCDDYEDATIADKDGSYTPEEAGFSPPIKSAMTLSRGGAPGTWRIVGSEGDGRC